MAGNVVASAVTRTIFSKFGIIAIVVLVLYLTGGFSIITDNPTIVIFLGLIFLVMNYTGKK